MPLFGTRGGASVRGFGFGAGGAEYFFLQFLSSATNAFTPTALVANSDGSVVYVGRESTNGQAALMHISAAGTVLAYKRMAPSGSAFSGQSEFTGIISDGSGGYVVSGYGYDPNTGSPRGFVGRLSSTFSTIWCKGINTSRPSSEYSGPSTDGTRVTVAFRMSNGGDPETLYSGFAAVNLSDGSSLGSAVQVNTGLVNFAKGALVIGSNYYCLVESGANPGLVRFNSSFVQQDARQYSNALSQGVSYYAITASGADVRLGVVIRNAGDATGTIVNAVLSGSAIGTINSQTSFGAGQGLYSSGINFSQNGLISTGGYKNTSPHAIGLSVQNSGVYAITRPGMNDASGSPALIDNVNAAVWGGGLAVVTGGTSRILFKVPYPVTTGSASPYTLANGTAGTTTTISSTTLSPYVSFTANFYLYNVNASFTVTDLALTITKIPYA